MHNRRLEMNRAVRGVRGMALVIRLITIGGVLLVTMIPVPGLADSNGSCSATGSIAGCLGDRDGTIDVSGEVRRRGRQGQQSRPHAPTAIASEAAATAAYCADAAANANATTTAAASAETRSEEHTSELQS